MILSLNSYGYEKATQDENYNYYQAAKMGDIKTLRAMINKRNDIIDAQDSEGYTALIYAAYYGQEEAVDFLLKSSANACAKDKRGNTATMGAIFKGNFKIAKKLMKTPCSISGTNRAGQTSLMYAALFNRVDIASELLRNGASPDQEDEMGYSARYLASSQGNEEMVELFLKDDTKKEMLKNSKKLEEIQKKLFIKEAKWKP